MRRPRTAVSQVLLAGLFLLLGFSFFSAAITQEAAQTKVKPYFGASDSAQLVASPPLSYNDQTFFLFYFHTNAARRVLAVVNGETGTLETIETTLQALGTGAYRLDVATYRLAPQLGFAEMGGFLSASKSKIDTVSTALPSARSQITSYANSVDISDLESKLSDATEKMGSARGSVDEGGRLESEFVRSGTLESLNAYYDQYTNAFDDMTQFLDAANAYDTALKAKAAAVNKDSSLTVDQKRNINTALGSLSLDSDGSLLTFRSRTFEPGSQEFKDFKDAQDAWVTASIEGFGFLRAKTDAENLQNELAASVSSLKANKRAYQDCNADPSDAIKTFDDTVKVINQASATSSVTLYQAAQASLADLSPRVAELKDRFIACQNGPTATPTPATAPSNPGNNFAGPLILFVIILGVIFTLMKRKPPEGSGEDANAGV